MSNDQRYVPPGGAVVSIVQRCLLARFLLKPSDRLNRLAIGIIAKAQRRFGVEVYLGVLMSNHLHLLIHVDDAKQMADFMEFVAGNLAREANRLYGWSGTFWDGEYSHAIVAEDEASLYERLDYLLSQGCKENLVASPLHWPGVHAAKMLLSKKPRLGVWVDRTALYRARQARTGKPPRAIDFEEKLELKLSPLPCWKHLTPEAYRARIREEITRIETETAARHRREGTRPLGRHAVLHQDPHHRPQSAKKSRAPLIHAASKAVRDQYQAAYRQIVNAFREASIKLRAGDLTVVFPEGTFPPGLPFVPFTAEPRAG